MPIFVFRRELQYGPDIFYMVLSHLCKPIMWRQNENESIDKKAFSTPSNKQECISAGISGRTALGRILDSSVYTM